MEIALYILIGLVVGYAIARLTEKKQEQPNLHADPDYIQKSLYIDLQNNLKTKEETIVSLNSQLSAQKEKNIHLEKRIEEHTKELEGLNERMSLEFKNLSNKIFEEKSTKFLELNEKRVGEILNPLKEKIKDFETKVDKNFNEETREKASLRKELEQIIRLNQQVSEDASRLTNALKGDKKLQGDWGEIQLEMILKKAGLEEGIHYTKQETFETEGGKTLRTDYVIYLPEQKNLIIDSKVSLVAYEQYFNEENEAAKQNYLKEHIRSITNHIISLGDKNYHKIYNINSPDYILMFVPIEPALYAALKEENRIFEKALDKNIVLVTTSTLLATLRTISYIWKQENQRKNVAEIAEESGQLYDKFVGFVEDLINVGKKINDTKSEYDNAMNKLVESKQKGGTIVGRMERIKKLGANTTKSIPQALINRADDTEQQP